MTTPSQATHPRLTDPFNRSISYLRISVTDRCDFRCVYCMSEEMTFLPKKQILTLEEIELVCKAFTELGVDKIRITGGEPLVRHNVMSLINRLGSLKKNHQLNELLLTTNGSQLTKLSDDLKSAGINRINVSLDSLNTDKFKALTRTGDLETVLAGIQSAKKSGIKVKLNAVILKGRNDNEILPLVNYARENDLDISFIEEMPLGNIEEHDRSECFMPSDDIKSSIHKHYPLTDSSATTGGPSRYFQMTDSDIKIGFISPHSHNFCSDCNRVRVTVEGRLLLCLGNEHSVDLKTVLRQNNKDEHEVIKELKEMIIDAMNLKPERHHFDLDDDVQVIRFMNMTGG